MRNDEGHNGVEQGEAVAGHEGADCKRVGVGRRVLEGDPLGGGPEVSSTAGHAAEEDTAEEVGAAAGRVEDYVEGVDGAGSVEERSQGLADMVRDVSPDGVELLVDNEPKREAIILRKKRNK